MDSTSSYNYRSFVPNFLIYLLPDLRMSRLPDLPMQPSLSHTIYQKLQKLVKEYEQLKNENQKLQRQLNEQLAAAKKNNDKVDLLESQVAMLKSSLGQMDAGAKKELERRIQQYIKDIDTAIKLLNE